MGTETDNVQTVDIYDGERFVQSIPVTNGRFDSTIAGLGEGGHSFRARIGAITSNAWNININTLQIDPSLMRLDGWMVQAHWPMTGNDAPDNTRVRAPTGGTPPYSYVSDHPEIATVTSAGKVQGVSNGTARITVRDAENNSVGYPVEVSNVYRLIMDEGPFNAHAAMAWILNIGGTLDQPLVRQLIDSMIIVYRMPFPTGQVHHWLFPHDSSPNTWVFFHYETQGLHFAGSDNSNVRGAWCFFRNGPFDAS